MKELKRIIEVYDKIDFSKRRAALATVVKLYGSSYRRPGARMLITDDGRWEGAISGGCLEGDALRKARQVMSSGKPMVVTYDTMDDNNSSFGIGLGCNGIIDVLIEPLYPDHASNPFQVFKKFTQHPGKELAILATVSKVEGEGELQLGNRWLLLKDASITSNTLQNTLPDTLLSDMNASLQQGKPHYGVYTVGNSRAEIFVEILQPGIQLIVFGGGYDAAPVVSLAKEIGFNVTVTDDCVAHLTPLRFPKADALKHVDRFSISQQLTLTRHTAALLISHNFNYDLAVLEQLLETDVPYIGILGPRKRTDKMLKEYTAQGKTVENQDLDKIYSPVGLDIGAETPEEIALSVLSEIQAFFNNKQGGFLKNKKGFIHDRAGETDEIVSSREYTIGDTCAL